MPPNPVTIAPDQAPPLRGEPVARSVFTGLPGRYDRLAYLLSFGQDRRWRAAVVSHTAAASPGLVLDVATGPAGIALAVAGRTGADVVGVDLNEPMLRAGLPRIRSREQKGRGGAWTEERQASLRAPERRGKASPSSGPEASGRAQPGPRGRVRVAAGRADQLPFADATFDAVTFSYLLRYVDDPAATIAEMARCLRPGGTLACLEFYVPPRPAWHAAWWCYTRLALPVLGGVTGGPAWYRVGRFLGPSISTHYRQHPLGSQVSAWRAAGLTDVGTDLMSLGGGLVMWGRKEGGQEQQRGGS